MIVNDFFKNNVKRTIYSKVITLEDDGDDDVYIFPSTKGFLNSIQRKRNAEKLYGILNRIQ